MFLQIHDLFSYHFPDCTNHYREMRKILIKFMKLEAVETAHLLKLLLHQHKGVFLIPRTHIRKSGRAAHVCNPRSGHTCFSSPGFSG